MNESFSEFFTFRFTSTFLVLKFKRSPNSHDNIPSILSKNLRALRGLCGEYVTPILARSTWGPRAFSL